MACAARRGLSCRGGRPARAGAATGPCPQAMEGAVSIVMGLDQHRAQITAEWLDTDSGELHRRRVSPADRAGVRAFATRFAGQELDVALEATTGWRFAAEELAAAGARVHLAEPAEAALRGTKR